MRSFGAAIPPHDPAAESAAQSSFRLNVNTPAGCSVHVPCQVQGVDDRCGWMAHGGKPPTALQRLPAPRQHELELALLVLGERAHARSQLVVERLEVCVGGRGVEPALQIVK